METLGRVSGGDLRRAITTLQSAVRLKGTHVEPQTLLDVAGSVPKLAIDKLYEACGSGVFAKVQTAIGEVIADGYPVGVCTMGDGSPCKRSGVWFAASSGCKAVGFSFADLCERLVYRASSAG